MQIIHINNPPWYGIKLKAEGDASGHLSLLCSLCPTLHSPLPLLLPHLCHMLLCNSFYLKTRNDRYLQFLLSVTLGHTAKLLFSSLSGNIKDPTGLKCDILVITINSKKQARVDESWRDKLKSGFCQVINICQFQWRKLVATMDKWSSLQFHTLILTGYFKINIYYQDLAKLNLEILLAGNYF